MYTYLTWWWLLAVVLVVLVLIPGILIPGILIPGILMSMITMLLARRRRVSRLLRLRLRLLILGQTLLKMLLSRRHRLREPRLGGLHERIHLTTKQDLYIYDSASLTRPAHLADGSNISSLSSQHRKHAMEPREEKGIGLNKRKEKRSRLLAYVNKYFAQMHCHGHGHGHRMAWQTSPLSALSLP